MTRRRQMRVMQCRLIWLGGESSVLQSRVCSTCRGFDGTLDMVVHAETWAAKVRDHTAQSTWPQFIRCTLRGWTGESSPGPFDQTEHVWQALKSKVALGPRAYTAKRHDPETPSEAATLIRGWRARCQFTNSRLAKRSISLRGAARWPRCRACTRSSCCYLQRMATFSTASRETPNHSSASPANEICRCPDVERLFPVPAASRLHFSRVC